MQNKFAVRVINATFLYREISETKKLTEIPRWGQTVAEQRKRLAIGRGVGLLAYVIETHLHISESEEGGEWRTNLTSSKCMF